MLTVKCAASWVSDTPWDVELSVCVFSWEELFGSVKSQAAEVSDGWGFSSSVNLIASLSFPFHSQPWISSGLFPSFPGGGWALARAQCSVKMLLLLLPFNRPDYRNCLRSGGCLCIPGDTLALPVYIPCLGVVEGHSDCGLFPTWPVLSGYNICFIQVNLFWESKSVHGSGTILEFAVIPLQVTSDKTKHPRMSPWCSVVV